MFVGKLTTAKGALDLATLAQILSNDLPGLKVVYLGQDCSYRGRISFVGLSPRRLFPGALPHTETLAWLGVARAFARPSHLEAFSMAPFGAMVLRVPLIYTRPASGPKLIDDARTGLLVAPAKPQQVAAAVRHVDSDFGSKLVSAAQAALDARFSLARCTDMSLSFYAAVLHKSAGPAFGGCAPEGECRVTS